MVASPNVNLSDLKRRLEQARIEKERGDNELQTSPVVDASVIQLVMVRPSALFFFLSRTLLKYSYPFRILRIATW
jgi:hypothetical protein